MLEKKSKKKIAGMIGILVLIAITICIGISSYNKPDHRLERALALGQKYLLEKDYERAIVEFDKAIEIEAMNVEAYLGKAEAYIGLENPSAAVKVLEEGYELTGNNEILQKLEELRGVNAETEIEEAEETGGKAESEDESEVPYFELGFAPEDFTVAGYSVMDGDHVEDVLAAASEIMPNEDNAQFDFEYDGWSYKYITDLSYVYLYYRTLRYGHFMYQPVIYGWQGDMFMIAVRATLDMNLPTGENLPTDDPAFEFPLYEGPIVPVAMSYEECLDILGIRELMQTVDAADGGNDVKHIEFESQYGACRCGKYEEGQDMSIYITLYSYEREKGWNLDLDFEDNVLCWVRVWKEKSVNADSLL